VLHLLVWCCVQRIETDETAKKPDQLKLSLSSEEERVAIAQLEEVLAADNVTPGTHTHTHTPGTHSW